MFYLLTLTRHFFMPLKTNNRHFHQNRREFIKHIGLGSSFIALSPFLSKCGPGKYSDLYNSFIDPAAEARPFFRWWWNGNHLSKNEIERELLLMKEAGIGGIEINPIQMPDQVEDPVGREVSWLSDDWLDFLDFAIKKANDLGMVVDLIVGTGWPFGGKFLAPEETIQGITLKTINLTGPDKKEITLPQLPDAFQSEIKQIILIPSEIHNLTDAKEITFNKTQDKIAISIPKGDHKLLILSWQNNFRNVMHGAPGGDGPVLDHFNKKAVAKYLNHMSDTIKQKTGKSSLEGIRAMFCDSIELNGANWTTGFEEVFEERRGYDIQPYLPLLLADGFSVSAELEDELKRVRYDYSLTLSELFMESFIIPFHNWCHENGTLSRYQAYGHPWLYTDLLDGNMVPDIPEGDQWIFNGGWQPYADVNQIRYAIWNKYTSSGGHLANRKIISSEAMTNTSGVFKASLKYIKQATDLNIATGINHLVLHGFNYSPPEAEFPGWIRYGCYYNEKNPWWKYMNVWTDYTSRISQIFQKTTPVSQVAIMGPTADIWAEHGLDRNLFNLEPWYLHALWQALNHNGFGTDYVNARLLKEAKLEKGKILIGQMHYEVLLICDVESMEAEVARHLEELSLQGARIILVGKKAHRSPSMLGALKNDGIVKKSIETALQSGILTAPVPHNKLKNDKVGLMKWAGELMNNCVVYPEIKLTNPSPDLFQIHQKYHDQDIIFLTNMNENKTYKTSLKIGNNTEYASLWDPATCEKFLIRKDADHNLSIHLQPLGSILIVCDPNNRSNPKEVMVPETREAAEISTPWKISLNHVDGSATTTTQDILKPINQLPEHENFGGEIIYTTEFKLSDINYTSLKIEKVFETAEVMLNGKILGLSWYGNNFFDLQKRLKKGTNILEIKVTTLLANYISSLKGNKTAQFWSARYKDKNPVPCGLSGKVTLS